MKPQTPVRSADRWQADSGPFAGGWIGVEHHGNRVHLADPLELGEKNLLRDGETANEAPPLLPPAYRGELADRAKGRCNAGLSPAEVHFAPPEPPLIHRRLVDSTSYRIGSLKYTGK